MKYLYILFLSCILYSCGKNKFPNEERIKEEKALITDSTILINVMSNVREKYPLSHLIDTIRYVSLEYTDEALIGVIRRMKVVNNLIYILDLNTDQLKCFNNEGGFIRNACKKGGGPEEVGHLIDFDVDENYLYILDGAKITIHVYDHNGKYIEKRNLPFRAHNFKVFSNEGYLFGLAPFSIDDENNSNLLAFTDLEFNPRSYLLKYVDNVSMGISFENQQNSIYSFTLYGNGIYEKRDSILFMKYYLDFGGKYFNANKDVNGFEEAIENGIYFTSEAPCHDSNYLLQSYYAGLQREGTLFIRLRDNKAFFVKDLNEDRNDVFNFSFGHTMGYDCVNEEFYGICNYLDLSAIESSDKEPKIEELKGVISKEVQPFLLQENAEKSVNQILMFYKLKVDIDFN